MSDVDAPRPRGLAPLLLLCAAVVLVASGSAQGFWLSNAHNGLLGLAFACVGAYVLHQRPGHREGRLFLATGTVESVLFFGRQVGHVSETETGRWLGWFGVWPTAIALGLTTLSVICYPDGRVPSPAWRWVVRIVIVACAACATASAFWPVEYGSAGLRSGHPITADPPSGLGTALVHSVYIALQLLWVVAVVMRLRVSSGHERQQLASVLAAAGVSVAALLVGLVVWRTPTPGLLAAAVVPAVAGWAIVHRQHVVAYSALSWLSRIHGKSDDLATDLARTVAESLDAERAILWVGRDELHAVGVWPPVAAAIAPTTMPALLASSQAHVRVVTDSGTVIGAIGLARDAALGLSLAQSRLLDDLAAQASLVIEHLGLTAIIVRRRGAAPGALTERERTVLELIARGYSNGAICAELHLSIKTVEPVVSAIFSKLGLPADARGNRRVLAVLSYLRN